MQGIGQVLGRGSTGPAKGVTHSNYSLRWMIASAGAAFELTADDAFLPGSSMSHIGSFLWALSTLAVGGRVILARHHGRPGSARHRGSLTLRFSRRDPGGPDPA